MTIHVKPDGNDANDGLAESRAKRTIQAAINAVPERIEHPVDIAIWPGIYREQVRIRNRRLANADSGRFRLKGMGANPDAVRISGTDANNSPVLSLLMNVQNSEVSLFNLTLENSTGVAILATNYTNLSALRCNLRSHPDGALMLGAFSFGLFEDVVAETTVRRNQAIEVSTNSILVFRDDHILGNGTDGVPAFIGDPNNSVKNTIRNYATGIGLHNSASVAFAQNVVPVFDLVDTNVQKHGTVISSP